MGICSPVLQKSGLDYWSKTGARKSPLKSRVKFAVNRVFLENTRFKRYFLWAWTPIPWEPGNQIRKWGIGARIEPGIGYLSGTLLS
jgi:hypothetical protein